MSGLEPRLERYPQDLRNLKKRRFQLITRYLILRGNVLALVPDLTF